MAAYSGVQACKSDTLSLQWSGLRLEHKGTSTRACLLRQLAFCATGETATQHRGWPSPQAPTPLSGATDTAVQHCAPTFSADFVQQHVEGALLRQRLPKVHHLDGHARRCGCCQELWPQVLLGLGRTSSVSRAVMTAHVSGNTALALATAD